MEDKTSDKDLKSAFHNEIINLSVKERVLSPYTSLLVLETENDYRRYNIDRRGLADILTIGADGIEVIKRAGVESAQPIVMPVPVPEEPVTRSKGGGPTEDRAVRAVEEAEDVMPRLRLRGATGADNETDARPSRPAVTRGAVDGETRRYAQPSRPSRPNRPTPQAFDDDDSEDETTMSSGAPPVHHVAPSLTAPAAPMPEIATRGDSTSTAEEVERSMEVDRPAAPPPTMAPRRSVNRSMGAPVERKQPQVSPWTGKYAEFRALLDKDDIKAAGLFAQQWRQENLVDVMALIALGDWYEKTGNTTQAARAYGSLIDYFPARADIRRWAAERLLSLNATLELCIDSLNKAVQQRPDHPAGHYLLAIAYWEAGQYKEAVEALVAGLKRKYQRFQAAKRILAETYALMLTYLQQQQQLETLFKGQKLTWEPMTQDQLRLVLMWETDANDVDFHIYDNQQHHAYYSQKTLPTGGTLYADITTGYGPECFSITEPKAFPYKLQAHYYSMGPMGYGMGVLHVLKYEPKTGLHSEFRPFVVMKNQAFVDLGLVKK